MGRERDLTEGSDIVPRTAFTLVTGLVSLAGFVIQLFDLFPKLGKARLVGALLLVGVFVGSLLRAIEPASVKLNIQITGFSLLVAVFAVVTVSLLVWAGTTVNNERRGELFGAAITGFLGLLFVLGIGGLANAEPYNPSNALTIQELNVLVQDASRAGDIERAIRHLQTIEGRLRDGEARKNVEERIRALERQALR